MSEYYDFEAPAHHQVGYLELLRAYNNSANEEVFVHEFNNFDLGSLYRNIQSPEKKKKVYRHVQKTFPTFKMDEFIVKRGESEIKAVSPDESLRLDLFIKEEKVDGSFQICETTKSTSYIGNFNGLDYAFNYCMQFLAKQR